MNTPKKLLLVVDARLINTSGIGTVIQNTIPYLLPYFEIVLLGNPSELNKFAWALNCQIIKFISKIYSLQEQAAFIIKIPRCDIFFSPHYNVPIYPIKAKKRVVIIHDVNHMALGADLSIIKRQYARFVIKAALKLSDQVITVSQFSKREIIKYFNEKDDRIHTLKLGVDKQVFQQYNNIDKAKVKQKYNLPDNFILYVGNVKPHKNLKMLVQSFALLQKEHHKTNFKLVIVGKKDGFITADNHLFNLIAALNLTEDVIFTGYVSNEDLPLLYNLAALFVFPSLYEGFGLPPIEAMACGCPTLVANSSSLPEVCQNAAYFFDPTEPQALCRSIVNILDNNKLQQQLKEKGFALTQTYNWQTTAQQLTDIICNNK